MAIWSHLFPLDLWWRHKYNIPFGSEAHKRINYAEICFDYIEHSLLKEASEETEDFEDDDFIYNDSDNNQVIVPKNKKVVVKASKKEIATDFADLNLDDFNETVNVS